jgi:hypothetical protein
MKKKIKPKLITIKVTELALKNFNIASALSGKPQYEVSEEGSHFVHGKYLINPNHSSKKVK